MGDSDATGETGESAGDVQAELARLREENASLRQRITDDSEKPNKGYRRRWLSITCAVLGAILLPFAVLTVWTRNTMLDTSEFESTVGPLVEDEDIQEAVSFRVTEAVAEAADFRSLAEEALPEEAQILAGPIESGAKNLVNEVVAGLVASDQFADLWRVAVREAHSALVPLLEGRESNLVGTSEGRVTVKLDNVATEALDRVNEQFGTEFELSEDQLAEAQVVLVESDELADAQDAVRVFDALTWFTVILALLFLAGAVFFAERRRRGVRRLGFGIVISMMLTLILVAWARELYLSALPDDVHNPDAAAAIFDISIRFLRQALRTALVVGLVLLAGAWVMGPSSSAARVRGWWDTLLGRASDSGGDREPGAVLRFVAERERGLLIGAAVVGGLLLVLWTHPTGWVVLFLVILTLLVMGAIRVGAEIVRRSDTAEPDPDVEEATPV
ncbi:MAG: hypothetical protein OES57_05045 [Acidimicrobiia bacterium]|nr:hypothetical protein [Acidimicrobiia bacterium]